MTGFKLFGMKRLSAILLFLAIPVSLFASSEPISRRDGFLLIWDSISRLPDDVTKQKFSDVPTDAKGFREITFARNRYLLDQDDTFRPDEPLTLADALVWLFRTRNIADPDEITLATLSDHLAKYPIANVGDNGENLSNTLTEEDLMTIMRRFDADLATEVHEASLYAENFHGQGTAFGESFDMYAMTAAHRTFPHNTLVKVTNVANGKSVIVRINDRGPYVKGRDMDLSLGAFTSIASRSLGKINVTFQRLGDSRLQKDTCAGDSPQQQRLGKGVVLQPGIPHSLPLGNEVFIRSSSPFVIRGVTYPDGIYAKLENWVMPEESYTLKPSMQGHYVFKISSKNGRARDMEMEVVRCGELPMNNNQ